VEEVGGAAADVGAVVGHVGEEMATIRRAAQGLQVGVQDGDVTAVAGQRVKHAGAHGRCNSVGGRKELLDRTCASFCPALGVYITDGKAFCVMFQLKGPQNEIFLFLEHLPLV